MFQTWRPLLGSFSANASTGHPPFSVGKLMGLPLGLSKRPVDGELALVRALPPRRRQLDRRLGDVDLDPELWSLADRGGRSPPADGSARASKVRP